MILRGDITHVDGSSLTFRVRGSQLLSGVCTGSIQLKGKWQADKYNRITFQAARSRGRYDTLTFQGAWKVNRHNELIYRYSRTHLKTKTKKTRTLTFKGVWDLGKNRIVYRLDGAKDSFFSLKAGVRSQSLFAREGKIKYNVGVRYSKRKVYKKVRQTVTIYGTWKLMKDLKIGFEVTYSGRKRQEIQFFAEKFIVKDGSIAVSLKKKDGERMGIWVTFTVRF